MGVLKGILPCTTLSLPSEGEVGFGMAPKKGKGKAKGKRPVKRLPPRHPTPEEVSSDEGEGTVEWTAIMAKLSDLEHAKELAPPAKKIAGHGRSGHRTRQATTKELQ